MRKIDNRAIVAILCSATLLSACGLREKTALSHPGFLKAEYVDGVIQGVYNPSVYDAVTVEKGLAVFCQPGQLSGYAQKPGDRLIHFAASCSDGDRLGKGYLELSKLRNGKIDIFSEYVTSKGSKRATMGSYHP